MVAAVVLLLLAVGGLVWFATSGDNEGDAPSAGESTSGSAEATDEPSDEPSDEPTDGTTEEPTEEPPESTEPPAATQGVSGQEAVALLEDYYATLPGDLDAGWATLAPDLQDQIGRDSYDGFWSTISTVEIITIQDVGGGGVDVTLTYDGGSRETRRLQVAEVDGEPRIVADRVVS